MKLVSFGVAVIQGLRRVTLNSSLLRNLGIKEGDTVELFLDIEEETIVIKKSQNVRNINPRVGPGGEPASRGE